MAAQQRARGEESASKVGESSADLRAPASDECGAAAALGLQDSALGSAINSALQIYFSNTAQRQRQRQAAAPRVDAPQAAADRATTPPPSTARASAACSSLVLQTPPKPRRIRHREPNGARDSPVSSGDELGRGADAPAPVPWDSPGMSMAHWPCTPGGKDESVPCTPLTPNEYMAMGGDSGFPRHFLGWAGWSAEGEEYPSSEHIATTFSPPREEAFQQTEWGPVPMGYDNWSWPAWNSYQFPPTLQPQGLASAGLPPGCFKFTLRKADGNSLGLIVSHKEKEFIRVEEVQQGGAVDAWNRQCVGHVAWKAVRPGDLIIEVNGKDGSTAMFSEIKSRQLLRITIFRGIGSNQRPIRKFKCGEELETDVLAGLLKQ